MQKRKRSLWYIVISVGFLGLLTTSCGVEGEGGSASLTLHWEPPTTNVDGTELNDLAGFKIYYGIISGEYTEVTDIKNPNAIEYMIENLPPGTYYFAATAYDIYGNESSYSNEVSKIVN
ncbi:MAG TPA: hypothetical protein DDX84_02410 [Nitrospiraceae bacterium]|nr:hypothetical protein [Nitrospiraceae bacterium]